MQLRTLISSQTGLNNLVKCALPISISWNLTKFINVINPELVSYNQIWLQKVQEFGVKQEGTDTWTVLPENNNEFQKQMNELLDKEIVVDIPEINIADVLAKPTNVMTAEDLLNLSWLIK